MAHDLNFRNGKPSIAYTGEKPWHGLGTELKEAFTSEEAIKVANLDFTVEKTPVYAKVNGVEQLISDNFANIRKDTGENLGIVGNRYQIIQNADAFQFFDNIVADKLAMYHVVGALGKGERVWILAKLPDDLLICGDDKVEKYLLLTNSHNGTSSLQMYFTPIRVVCNNTLIASTQHKQNCISIRHCGNIQSKVEQARTALGIAIDFYKEFDVECQALGHFQMNTQQLHEYYNSILKIDSAEELLGDITTQKENTKNRLLNLFEKGEGHDNPNMKHSAWAAYNAVTQYIDHDKTVKNLDVDKTNKLKNIWFGSGANIKAKAYTEIKKVVLAK